MSNGGGEEEEEGCTCGFIIVFIIVARGLRKKGELRNSMKHVKIFPSLNSSESNLCFMELAFSEVSRLQLYL